MFKLTSEQLTHLRAGSPNKEAFKDLEDTEAPSTEMEDWRYSELLDFDYTDLLPVAVKPSGVSTSEQPGASVSVSVAAGHVVAVAQTVPNEQVTCMVDSSPSVDLMSNGNEYLDRLNRAANPERLVIDIAPSVKLAGPIVVHVIDGTKETLSFPSVEVRVGEASRASLVEIIGSKSPEVICGFTKVTVAEGGDLDRLAVVTAGDRTRSLWSHQIEVQAEAKYSHYEVSISGGVWRSYIDCRLMGEHGLSRIGAASAVGGAQQVEHRVYQHHHGANTTSDLLFKTAAGGTARAVYTGLVHIHPGAQGSVAKQTNRTIKLSDDAMCTSVPNLEIENNLVQCAHASTVNPLDDRQLFYLASKGVPEAKARSLLVTGFLRDVIRRIPEDLIDGELAQRLYAKSGQLSFGGS